jgi:uncharacterized protein with HEPN domain
VLWRLITIGEAATQVSSAVRRGYPDVPWTAAIAFRNRVVHGYFSIDWKIVWDTATLAIPTLRAQIAAILLRDYPSADQNREQPEPPSLPGSRVSGR